MKKYVIGADVGGTTVKLGFFTTDGELTEKWEIPTDTSRGGDILSDIAGSCQEKMKEMGLDKEEFAGIGIGVPGTVVGDGFVDSCVNLGWGQKHVKDEIEAALGLPAAVGNDANMAALGEVWKGSASGYQDAVMVTLGTGVGGGIIIGGKVITGAHGYGGEIGHITLNSHETVHCNCGKAGCVEQYCSATGIVNETKKALGKADSRTSLKSCDPLTARDIFDAAKAGDPFAITQVDLFGKRLARALSFISGVIDPEVFVIGGGVSKAGQIIIDHVEKHFKDFTYGKQQTTGFVLASLGNDAGIYGCAKLILG
ncbi:MAG: ROK family glucokinase [Eubacterium sp.]|nr:ROK family glucokinase [Eubacterium sp.]